MSGYKKGSCKMCLKDITDKGFQLIDDVTRNILDSLLLKLVSRCMHYIPASGSYTSLTFMNIGTLVALSDSCFAKMIVFRKISTERSGKTKYFLCDL